MKCENAKVNVEIYNVMKVWNIAQLQFYNMSIRPN